MYSIFPPIRESRDGDIVSAGPPSAWATPRRSVPEETPIKPVLTTQPLCQYRRSCTLSILQYYSRYITVELHFLFSFSLLQRKPSPLAQSDERVSLHCFNQITITVSAIFRTVTVSFELSVNKGGRSKISRSM